MSIRFLPSHFVFNLFFILSILVSLCSCGGKKAPGGGETNPERISIIINTPDVIEWDENRDFQLEIDATGDSDLSYFIRQSSDSNLFELDPLTGILYALQPFDFENPIDRNADGRIEVSVAIIDTQQNAKTLNLTVVVKDIEEPSAAVTFPPAGGNAGGFKGEMTFRGTLTVAGVPLKSVPDGISVKVNGAEADFATSADVMEWTVQAPLIIGDESVRVEVLRKGSVQEYQDFPLENHPVLNLQNAETDWQSKLFFLGDATETISVYDKTLGSVKTILTVYDENMTGSCSSFSRPVLSPSKKKLALKCFVSQSKWFEDEWMDVQQFNGFVVLDTETYESNLITCKDDCEVGRYLDWYDDESLISGDGPATWINIQTNEKKFFTFPDANLGYHHYIIEHIEKNHIFARSLQEDLSFILVRAELDLNKLTNVSWENILPVEPVEAVAIPSDARKIYTISGDRAYYVEGDSIVSTTLNAPYDKSVFVNNTFLLENSEKIEIISEVSNERMCVVTSFWRFICVNPVDESADSIFNFDGSNNCRTVFFLKPDQKTLGAINKCSLHFYKFNLSDFSLQEDVDLTDFRSYFPLESAEFEFDWASETLYSSVSDYWGVAPSDLVQIHSINIKSKKITPILTGNDFQKVLSVTNSLFVPGKISMTPDPKTLWLAMGVRSDANEYDGIYSLNLELNTLQEIYQYIPPEGMRAGGLYLGSYNDAIDGAILTSFFGGSLRKIGSNGEVDDLLLEDSPYRQTTNTDVDPASGKIYGIGLPVPPDGFLFGDVNELVYFEYDPATRSYREFADNRQRNKISLNVISDFKYDSKRAYLLAIQRNHLLLIDTKSGDRVYMPIKMQSVH